MVSIHIPSRNALFLHVPKTAGQSISQALEAAFPERTRYPIRHTRTLLGTSAFLATRIGGEAFLRRWTFCFLRNPWDWTVSGWSHVTRNKPAYDDPPDFAAFVKGAWADGPRHNPHPAKFRTARDFVAYHTQITQADHLRIGWRKRPVPVAFFARFEHLRDDWARICDRLGTEMELPHEHRSERTDYTTYYDDETRAIVARRNATLIERFGYRFGD